MLLFTVGAAILRTAVAVDRQPEPCMFILCYFTVMTVLTLSSLAFRFIGGDSLYKRILGALEKPPQALIDEVSSDYVSILILTIHQLVDGHRRRQVWLENLIFALIIHLYYKGDPGSWGQLDDPRVREELVITKPYSEVRVPA